MAAVPVQPGQKRLCYKGGSRILHMPTPNKPLLSAIAPLLFAMMVGLVGWHAYRFPSYGIDMLGYMENVAALESPNAGQIHSAVYREIDSNLPEGSRAHLLGLDNAAPGTQNASLRDRASNPDHFAEFLPCFAIRPLYVEFLYIVHRLGASLVKASVLGSVIPYLALAGLIFLWSSLYVSRAIASMLAFLLVMTPPVLNMARMQEPDCLSTLWACLALYFIFERGWLTAGFVFLLSSVYVRTDNVLLVLPVIAYLSLAKNEVGKWKAAALAAVAVASVLAINHFAGDYGWRMLYYRGFIAPPLAPGEFVPHFSLGDYKVALRSGVSALVNGSFGTYFLFGLVGYLASRKRAIGEIFAIVVIFSAIHFVIFPLPEDRYLALFYVVAGLVVISGLSTKTKPEAVERAACRDKDALPQPLG